MAEEKAANTPNEGSGPTTAAVAPPKPAATKPAPKLLPPYKVLLHNDDINDVEYVILTILRLTPLEQMRAIECTLEAHDSGVALLLVTHQERAELYQEQFQSARLTVTIEPDEA